MEECVFYSSGYCILDEKQCTAVSKYAMREFPDLDLKDHLELHWRRLERRAERKLKLSSLAVSLLALVVAALSLLVSLGIGGPLEVLILPTPERRGIPVRQEQNPGPHERDPGTPSAEGLAPAEG